MCAASRALRTVALLGAGCLLTAAARAEPPVISGPPGTGAPATGAASVPPPPSAPPSGSAPPFTPAPVPPFTAGGVAAPPTTYVAPGVASGYVAPAYSSPPGSTAPVAAQAAYAAPVGAMASGWAPAELTPAGPHAGDPRWNDAHVDRVVLMPTAETHPAGTTYLSSYEIIGLQAGHALGDRTQLTLTFVPAFFGKDPLVPIDLTLKGVLARGRRARVAAMASASGFLGYDSGAAALGRVGGVTQLCFDDACASSVSMGANLTFAGSVFILADAIGVIAPVSSSVAVLGELQTVLPIGRDGGQIHALGGALGIRFFGKRLALDVALEGPLDRRTNPQLVPVLIGTYRFLP